MVDLPAAKGALAELEPALIRAHEVATKRWADLCKQQPEMASPCNTTTRANFIHNHVEFQISREVEELPGVTVAEGLGFTALQVGTAILLRFKYVGRGCPQNVSTTQQRLLAKQTFTEDMLLALDVDSALTPPTMLTCGYTLQDGKLGRIEIRRDCKGHQPWYYDIHGGKASAQPLVFDGMTDDAKPARISKPKKKRAGLEGTA
jgi:hypothetical protein